MNISQILIATLSWAILLLVVFTHCGWKNIIHCFSMWFKKSYWTDYNIVEFLSWCAKAIIIVPGLLFGIQIWWLYCFTLITSLTLIWASNKKLLPTLVGFNIIWTWISCMVISQHILG
jgi:hypothetical protein